MVNSEAVLRMINKDLNQDKKHDINQKGIIGKIVNLLSYNYDYALMKIFSRIFLLKRIFLFFNRFFKNLKLDNAQTDKADGIKLRDGVSVDEIVTDLNKDGFSEKLRLSQKSLGEIFSFANKTRCYAYGNPKYGFHLSEKESCQEKLNKHILIAKYFNFQSEEVFAGVISSSLLQDIASKYLGRGAKNIATQLWWTFPADVDTATRSKAAHYYHRDVDAWGFVKFFFYLTDVKPGGGPHIYVKNSHKPNFIAQLFEEKFRINRHTDTAVTKRFGVDSICPMYGSPGAGLAADTFGFHKGESPKKTPRLMLCAVYATSDYKVQEFAADPEELVHYNE